MIDQNGVLIGPTYRKADLDAECSSGRRVVIYPQANRRHTAGLPWQIATRGRTAYHSPRDASGDRFEHDSLATGEVDYRLMDIRT